MLVLITGGVRSGKSKFGELFCTELNSKKMCYIATMYRDPEDTEVTRRIESHHRQREGKGFVTVERFTDLKSLRISGYDTAILECLPNALANEMFMEGGAGAEAAYSEIISGVENLKSQVKNLVVITNQVTGDGINYENGTAEYVKILCEINCRLAEKAHRVYEVVCGLPVLLKSSPKISDSFFLTFTMFSKLPAPRVLWDKDSMRYVLAFLPLIGLIIGGLEYCWFYAAAALGLNIFIYAAVATALPVIITGGIHLDGFIDTMDALCSYGDREKRLEILKDPHVGAFGVIYCVLYLLIQFALWTQIPSYGTGGVMLASIAFVASRVLGGLVHLTRPPAKSGGLGRTFRDGAHQKRALISLCICGAIVIAAQMYLSVPYGIVAVILTGLLALWHKKFVCDKFGGLTGDLTGHLIQCSELLTIALTALLPMIIS